MKIAVIGTGNMASALTRALAAAKYEVVVGHRDPAKAAALAADAGAGVEGGGIAAALQLADLAILALPYAASVEVVKAAGDLSGKVLVDISNPVSADFRDLVIGLTTSAAEEIQAAAPSARVVKAFNTVFAALIPAEARQGKSVQAFVAGDDAGATAQVRGIAQAMGFDPQDAGPLSNSRFLEPVGEMNIQFGFFLGKGPTVAPAWLPVAE